MASNPDISAAPREPLWRQKANAFWRWWTGELVQLVPERFAMHADRTPLLAIDANAAVLVDPRPGAGEQRAELAGLDDERRKAAVRGLLERAGEAKMRARAVLGVDEVLARRVTMPAATEENLRQVLSFEMDRLTPFRADEVYFDYRVLSRDAAAGQLVLQLAVARRELVDSRVAALRALGVSVQGVALREPVAAGAAPLDLMPSEQRGERGSPRERLVRRGLAIAVALLFAVALALPLVQKRSAWLALNPEVEAARQKAEATSTLASELDRQVADYNFLLSRKLGTYPAIAVLEDVTRLLPDNTWVQQMDIRTVGKAREVQIVGETASASKLIEILEGSTLLQNAAFRGTVTRGSQPNTERFMIAAEIRSRPLPEAKPVLEVASSILPPPPPPPAPVAPAPSAPAVPVVAPDGEPAAGPPAAPAGPPASAASPAPQAPQAAPAPSGLLRPVNPRRPPPQLNRPVFGPDGKVNLQFPGMRSPGAIPQPARRAPPAAPVPVPPAPAQPAQESQ